MRDFTDMVIATGGIELIDRIRPLWESLWYHYSSKSRYFGSHFKSRKFETRRKQFVKLAENGEILIEIVWHGPKNTDIAFSISSVIKEDDLVLGCVESLFVAADHRSKGIGTLLTRRALDWLKCRKCDRISLVVLDGKEPLYPFFRTFGFEIRQSVMELTDGKI